MFILGSICSLKVYTHNGVVLCTNTRPTKRNEETLHEDAIICKKGCGEGFWDFASSLEEPQKSSEAMELADHQ